MHSNSEFQRDDISSYPAKLFAQCEVLLSYLANRTASPSTPISILALLSTQNSTWLPPKTVDECVSELKRLLDDPSETNASSKVPESIFGGQERSRSLWIFVYLIAFVSLLSIAGNLCLAKVLYAKRLRLTQTDRIVLCLAISELCLVLVDSPTEIYRFLSFSFSITWLCRFHTFFESFFSSCIIFYHFLGAVDRFVYIHGHVSSRTSAWSLWCRRMATKSGSLILLALPAVLSLPIATCNLLHAHVIQTVFNMKICVVQYNHRLLISALLTFYIVPLLLAFFLHAKLIYFIRSRHTRRHLTPAAKLLLPVYRAHNNTDSQDPAHRKQRQVTLEKSFNHRQLHPPRSTTKKVVMFSTDTMGNTAGTHMTTTTGGQAGGPNNSSNSSASSRSSAGTSYSSLTSPMILYKVNLQADANAKRTVLLLVLLLSFYILCWAPYNVYTWSHVYQLTWAKETATLFSRTLSVNFNISMTSMADNIHGNLRRFIFINYSLYLLSLLSMCFSFVFYFSLNKHARQEFSYWIGCICPRFYGTRTKESARHEPPATNKRTQYNTRYQHHYTPAHGNAFVTQEKRREKCMRFTTHPMIVPPVSRLPAEQNQKRHPDSLKPKLEILAAKRTILNYGCHVQCCP